MEPQEILQGKLALSDFLKVKGYEEIENFQDSEFNEGIFFKINERKLLVIYEVKEIEKTKDVKNHFLIERGLAYCAIVHDTKIIFFRNFGEGRYFLYSDRTKDNISKLDKLKKIDTKFDYIFHRKDVSGWFYEKFKSKRNIVARSIKNDFKPVEKYLISQKLFDRIFFTYFLCHKGIITLNTGKSISGENLFRILLDTDNFFENVKNLFYLFNDAQNRFLQINDFLIKIPYLNGGLFRPDHLEGNLRFLLSEKDWGDVFDFLNQYHWIIEEDIETAIEDKENVLTPEILGHVYERSVVEWERSGFKKEAEKAINEASERKKKGVYYTPEEITEYIVENTIYPFILDLFNSKYNDVNELVENANSNDIKKALDALDRMKILDPACGSGAFLIKASEVLFQVKVRLLNKLGNGADYYRIKLNTIVNNIYGVDILDGAGEITKLRLWLWLVAEYKEGSEMHALPNIEYNIRIGNSLIGWINEELKQIPLQRPLTNEVDALFAGLITFCKNDIRKDLQKARDLLSTFQLKSYIEAYSILYKIYRMTHGLEAVNLKGILEKIKISIYSSVNPIFLEHINRKIDSNFDKKKLTDIPIKFKEYIGTNPFHWKIDFGHIIDEGGFDIIIGNPPYLESRDIPEIEWNVFKSLFKGAFKRFDLGVLFIERSLSLAKYHNSLGFIISNKFTASKYGLGIRKVILQNCIINTILDVSHMNVFKDAATYPYIFIFQKEPNKKVRENNIIKIKKEIKEGKIRDTSDVYEINQSAFADSPKNIFSIDLIPGVMHLLKRIKQKSIPLTSLCEMKDGIHTGNIRDKMILNKKENKNCKKLITAKCIDRYSIKWDKLWVNYDPSIFDKDKGEYGSLRDPRIFKAKEKLVTALFGLRPEVAYDDEQYYTNNSIKIILPRGSDIDLKYLMAILNSKLINFYYQVLFASIHVRGKYIQFYPNDFLTLPIMTASKLKVDAITKNVDQIMNLNKELSRKTEAECNEINRIKERIKSIDKKIDAFIFDIYGLNKKEIKLVDDYFDL
ncbi:MAG: TaqI-like C-terminal specificity domain-containing protein [Candidatus Bathyarchaeum tardum]|nr:MAG: TaqI-like C-terminal specificity domain-containing protein [Candidatus Bathyarchaeum tardum]